MEFIWPKASRIKAEDKICDAAIPDMRRQTGAFGKGEVDIRFHHQYFKYL